MRYICFYFARSNFRTACARITVKHIRAACNHCKYVCMFFCFVFSFPMSIYLSGSGSCPVFVVVAVSSQQRRAAFFFKQSFVPFVPVCSLRLLHLCTELIHTINTGIILSIPPFTIPGTLITIFYFDLEYDIMLIVLLLLYSC